MNILTNASLSEKYSIGQCGEMSFVGFKYAVDHAIKQTVSLFRIEGGDHAFLVIGETTENYSRWSLNSVICDPWSGGCYPANEIEMHLMNFEGVRSGSSRQFTLVSPFNPRRHSLCFMAQTLQRKTLKDEAILILSNVALNMLSKPPQRKTLKDETILILSNVALSMLFNLAGLCLGEIYF